MSFLDDGTLVVCGDYEGDLQQITEVLNQWSFDEWDDSNPSLQFVTDGTRIEADLIQTTFPSTRPVRRMLVFGDGRRIPRDEALEIEIGPEDEPYPEEDEIGLEEISKRISPLLTRGTLELVVVGHYRTKTAYSERLIIGSDGSVERRSQTAERDKRSGWLEETTETYVPITSAASAAVTTAPQQLSLFN